MTKFLMFALLCGTAFGQAELKPFPKFRAFDSNGAVCSGCKLYSYTAGTTTPQDTYTTAAGSVANTNPVILDSAGEANVWFGSASYKLILKSSTDVQQWSVDNINAAVTGTGSLVRATSPTIAAPAITGNMTYASTTPVSNLTASPPLYITIGAQQTNAHLALGSAALSSGTPSTLTVTLTGSAAFTSSSSYRCAANNETSATNTLKITYASGSSFTITGPNTVTDTVGFVCMGK